MVDSPEWIAHQRKRFMHPDAARWLKPDWRESKYWNGPPPDWVAHPLDWTWQAQAEFMRNGGAHLSAADAAKLADMRRELIGLKALVEQWRAALRAQALGRKYSQNQPRVPAGNPDGGQWTDGGGLTDFSAARRGRGHHYISRQLFDKKPFPEDTRNVFEQATTGPLHDERSNKFDKPHRIYNEAVTNHFNNFVERNQIEVQQMTPDQARQFLKEVQESRDPRIRNYNMRMLLREILKRVPFRSRGNE
jgi:hypothetical protein